MGIGNMNPYLLSIKGVDLSIPLRGFPFGTPGTPSWDGNGGVRRGYRT